MTRLLIPILSALWLTAGCTLPSRDAPASGPPDGPGAPVPMTGPAGDAAPTARMPDLETAKAPTLPAATSSPSADLTLEELVDAELAQARELFEQARYEEALSAAIVAEQMAPENEEVRRVLTEARSAILDRRSGAAATREDLSRKQMGIETVEAGNLPERYALKKFVVGTSGSHQSEPTDLQKALAMPVSMHLKGAALSELIAALSLDKHINIIADQGLAKGKTVDIEVDQVPLREILDYMTRNFAIEFYIGRNIIWATHPAEDAGKSMETRIYHLRRGLQFHGSDWGRPKEPGPQFQDINLVAQRATVLAEQPSYIETVLQQFIPQPEGALTYLDRNTHALLVRNTPEHLVLVERILDALDVDPPQVSIEARFIEVSVADLRELGLEWVLDSPLVVSKKAAELGGRLVQAPRTVVKAGDVVKFAPFDSVRPDDNGAADDNGDNGLTTGDTGLNLTYQGILTEPMFSAVLHALDIAGKGRTLSVPRVTTVNNNPAKLRNGEDLLYFDEFQAQAFNLVDVANRRYTVTALIPKGKPILEELGITLVAVPSVGADRKTVSLLLQPTISRLEGFISYQESGEGEPDGDIALVQQVVAKLPIIARREVQTKVVVQSGETVVMGGLIDTTSNDAVHKVPILGDIPLLGHLFRRMDAKEQRSNLLIFVTATVVSDRGEYLVPPPSERTAVPTAGS